MAKEAFYAVRVGKKPGIYRTWDECKEQVHGAKGAEYKKFKTREEAEAFLERKDGSPNVEELLEDEMIAYVDGSYNAKEESYGYGIVTLTAQGRQDFSGVKHDKLHVHRNVAGEVHGAIYAIQIALEEGMKKLYLYYDYAGIEHWALGEWKTNHELTREYKKAYDRLKDQIEVHFIKVKAHSSDYYNDEADRLAKEACDVGEEKKSKGKDGEETKEKGEEDSQE